MTKSTLRGKNQTTVPKEVRQKLGVGPNDALQWELAGDHVRVKAARPDFLEREGRIKVGPGDPVEDVRRARELMGRKGRCPACSLSMRPPGRWSSSAGPRSSTLSGMPLSPPWRFRVGMTPSRRSTTL